MPDAERRSPVAASIPAAFSIACERRGSTHRVAPVGELDLATSPELERALILAEQTTAPVIEVDLSGLTFIDATGIHVLERAHARSLDSLLRLQLRHGPSAVQRVFAIVGVDRTLPFTATRMRPKLPPRRQNEPRFVTEWSL